MKKFVLLFMMFFPLMGYCQTEEQKYYIYNIVSFEGEFTKQNFKVYYDDGKEVKRLRNDKDTKMRFTTPAGALMYFISQGWEMYLNGATSHGAMAGGYGESAQEKAQMMLSKGYYSFFGSDLHSLRHFQEAVNTKVLKKETVDLLPRIQNIIY